jgi:hypothetical protein
VYTIVNIKLIINSEQLIITLITLSPFRSSASPLYKQLHILKLCDIRKLQIALFMFKCQHSLLPESCMHYCRINLQHPYYMRQTHYFVTPAFRTSIREQCISIQGPKIWDSLPASLVAEPSLIILKHNVSDYLISSYWFSQMFFTVFVIVSGRYLVLLILSNCF